MKKILFLILASLGLFACGNNQKTSIEHVVKNDQKERIEVLYFHGKQRCIACNAIERLTKEVVENNFSEELKNGKITFSIIDISTKEGEVIADKYEVTWSSLYINQWKEDKETENNLTDLGFAYAKNSPEVFKAGVKEKIEQLLK